MGKGKTQRYYDANPAANKRRIAQQTRYNKNGKGNKIAREAVKLNRKMGTYGNGDGKQEKEHDVANAVAYAIMREFFMILERYWDSLLVEFAEAGSRSVSLPQLTQPRACR